MKKILILAYDFPPYVSVGGLRPFSWYKDLKQFGYEPVVVTRQWSNELGNELDYIAPGKSQKTIIECEVHGVILRTPYKPNLSNRLLLKHGARKFRLIRKLVSAWYEFTQFLFVTGPKKQLYVEASKYLSENSDVAAIVATGDPFVLFKYAYDLSRRYQVPWIADYRDPWSNDIYLKRKPLLRWWSALMERKTVRNADCVTTVNHLLAEHIQRIAQPKEIEIIINGFDSEAVAQSREVKQSDKTLQFAFIGQIYDWYPIESFFEVFNSFAMSKNVLFNFYGISQQRRIEDLLKAKYPELISKVHFHNRMPNKDLLRRIAADNVMILFNNYSIMGTKIFDYVGVKRKILLCYTNDSEAKALKDKFFKIDDSINTRKSLQADLLNETDAGIPVEDKSHLATVLNEIHDEFTHSGQINCKSRNTEVYSRRFQTQRLAEIVQKVTEQ